MKYNHRRPAGSLALSRCLRHILGRRCILVFMALLVTVGGCGQQQVPQNTLRVGVLKFGTVNWELATVQANNLAEKRGIHLEVLPLASENALAVALQGGRVDLIVSDWLWVARQRAEGRPYQFAPYSLAVGAVMVNPGAGIATVPDLAGHKLGIAGGPVDKTWLLLRAYAKRKYDLDLEQVVEPKYAAPPIINKLMLSGNLPAAINFWHYNARLLALGMEPLITVNKMLAALGVSSAPPLLGWVFDQHWADAHGKDLKAFLDATYEAKQILATSDAAWEALRDQVKPETDAVFAAIIAGYREGIPKVYGAKQIEAARKLFRILAKEGGKTLVGPAKSLPDDVFWDGFRLQ
ncbi:MAG: ABC transporter substrate-binding protein [Salinisphaera sp.]|nr:ABC transporter substrate-binding protein [Salinisphaera sp.]